MKLLAVVSLSLLALVSPIGVTQQVIPGEVTTVTRVDTSNFMGMAYSNPEVIDYLYSRSVEAYPNEAAFCIYGHVKDTMMMFSELETGEPTELVKKFAFIDSAGPANIKTATPKYVIFTDGVACDPHNQLIAFAHTHVNVPHPVQGGRCSHSDMDALYASVQQDQYWFTLVMCTWTHSLMWADGRRMEYAVRNPVFEQS